MAGNAAVQAAIEKTVIQTAKVIEDELDAEIEKLEHLGGDELDRLRCVLYLWCVSVCIRAMSWDPSQHAETNVSNRWRN